MVFKSTVKAKRQLVESSLIATNANCNLKPGDFPICRLTASVVTKSLKLDYAKSSSTATNAPPSTSVITQPNTSATPSIVPILVSNAHPATSTSVITQSDMSAIPPCESTRSPIVVSATSGRSPIMSSSDRPTTSSIAQHTSIQSPSAPSAPISVISPNSPPMLQSQARALSQSQAFASIILAASNCPSPTPVALKTRRRRILSPPPRPPPPSPLLSPYTSPSTPTGAISKRSKRRANPYNIPVRSLPSSS